MNLRLKVRILPLAQEKLKRLKNIKASTPSNRSTLATYKGFNAMGAFASVLRIDILYCESSSLFLGSTVVEYSTHNSKIKSLNPVNGSGGLYYKTLRTRNLQQMVRFLSKLIFSIVSHKHPRLYKYTSLQQNL
jgi:hypothetical protein